LPVKWNKTISPVALMVKKWIYANRKKTDTRSNIPLLPLVGKILNKYKQHPQCLNEGKLLLVLSN